MKKLWNALDRGFVEMGGAVVLHTMPTSQIEIWGNPNLWAWVTAGGGE
jgi:hypothetical protein